MTFTDKNAEITGSTYSSVEAVLLGLRVPRVIVEELADEYGMGVWRCVVRNDTLGEMVKVGVEALLESGTIVDYWCLALGAELRVGEVLKSITGSEKVPEWLVYHVVRSGLIDESDAVVVAGRQHSKELTWWLHDEAPLHKKAKRVVAKLAVDDKNHWYRVARAKTQWENDHMLARSAGRINRLFDPSRTVLEGTMWESTVANSTRIAELLGDGQDGATLFRWHKMLELLENDASRDFFTLAHSAVLVEGRGAGTKQPLVVA
jgi:hypothetical protein